MKKLKVIIIVAISAIFVAAASLNVWNWSQNESVPNEDIEIFKIDTTGASPIYGSANAPITIIDFSDYQCPKCNNWVQNTKPQIDKNFIESGKVNLVFMDLAVQGPDSIKSAEASYCAEEQDKYWEYHDILYNNQGSINSGWASSEELEQFALNLSLDMDLFNNCLESGKYTQRVLSNMEIAKSIGIKSTPTFVIEGPNGVQVIEGPQPFHIFEKTISDLLSKS